LSLAQANRKFREAPEFYQEDFMFMGANAFVFYFPVIESYLRETVECDEYGDRQAWILAHCILSQYKSDSPRLKHLLPRILELAAFVRHHIGLFTRDPDEQQRIDTAWRQLLDYIAKPEPDAPRP
jgi:hypothetical protein